MRFGFSLSIGLGVKVQSLGFGAFVSGFRVCFSTQNQASPGGLCDKGPRGTLALTLTVGGFGGTSVGGCGASGLAPDSRTSGLPLGFFTLATVKISKSWSTPNTAPDSLRTQMRP